MSKTYTPEELKIIIAKHGLWLRSAEGGERAVLRRAVLRRADLSGAVLRRSVLRRADLSGAVLSGADLQGSAGVLRAQVSWTHHGECGRQLIAVKVNDDVRYFCGCFSGSEQELRNYIANGSEQHRASRTLALEFCAARMTEMIAKRETYNSTNAN